MLDWLACELVKAVGAMLCRLPPSVAVRVGAGLGHLAAWCQPSRTRLGERNVRAAFDGELTPAHARRIVLASYRQMGAGVLELLRLPAMDQAYLERYLTVEGLQFMTEAAAAKRRVIFLTGHYGNWELSSIVSALLGFPIVVLARAQRRWPRLYRLLLSYRESKGCLVVHKGSAMRQLIRAMRQGRWIGIVGDQATRQGRFMPLFGRPALFATGPFELARAQSAWVLPAFIHRVRGPFHRLVIGPPIVMAPERPNEDAVAEGMQRFVEALSRHVREDPTQWLWMHKRWKYTPVRRVLILSDGKVGHLKQSQAVAELLRADAQTRAAPARRGGAAPRLEVEATEVEIRYRHPLARWLTLLWSWLSPGGIGGAGLLSLALTPQSRDRLLRRYADVVVSCGASLAPVTLLWARASDAKSVVVMNPAPLPCSRFSLVIVPRHDALPARTNVVPISGALAAPVTESRLEDAAARLRRHPRFQAGLSAPAQRRPVIGVFIGGDSAEYALSVRTAASLVEQVTAACETLGGWCVVTTSRRTPEGVERMLRERLEASPQCRLLLLAGRDPLNGTLEGMLGTSDVAVVTGESVSMVSEACASGRRVVVMEPVERRASCADTKHRRFLRDLAQEGRIRLHPVTELSRAIEQAIADERPVPRTDELERVEEALRRLL